MWTGAENLIMNATFLEKYAFGLFMRMCMGTDVDELHDKGRDLKIQHSIQELLARIIAPTCSKLKKSC